MSINYVNFLNRYSGLMQEFDAVSQAPGYIVPRTSRRTESKKAQVLAASIAHA